MSPRPLIPLRPWKDKDMMNDEGEEWRPNPTRDAAKALYEQWCQVFYLLQGMLPDEDDSGGDAEEANMFNHVADQIIGDGMVIAVKIQSSEVMGMFVPRMENAAIIRKAASDSYSALLLYRTDPRVDTAHVKVLREEIDVFRELFKKWVKSFQRDDWEDEWGLFV